MLRFHIIDRLGLIKRPNHGRINSLTQMQRTAHRSALCKVGIGELSRRQTRGFYSKRRETGFPAYCSASLTICPVLF
jgi:hypothetical protein